MEEQNVPKTAWFGQAPGPRCVLGTVTSSPHSPAPILGPVEFVWSAFWERCRAASFGGGADWQFVSVLKFKLLERYCYENASFI